MQTKTHTEDQDREWVCLTHTGAVTVCYRISTLCCFIKMSIQTAAYWLLLVFMSQYISWSISPHSCLQSSKKWYEENEHRTLTSCWVCVFNPVSTVKVLRPRWETDRRNVSLRNGYPVKSAERPLSSTVSKDSPYHWCPGTILYCFICAPCNVTEETTSPQVFKAHCWHFKI